MTLFLCTTNIVKSNQRPCTPDVCFGCQSKYRSSVYRAAEAHFEYWQCLESSVRADTTEGPHSPLPSAFTHLRFLLRSQIFIGLLASPDKLIVGCERNF